MNFRTILSAESAFNGDDVDLSNPFESGPFCGFLCFLWLENKSDAIVILLATKNTKRHEKIAARLSQVRTLAIQAEPILQQTAMDQNKTHARIVWPFCYLSHSPGCAQRTRRGRVKKMCYRKIVF